MDCIFCKIIKKEIPSKIIYEDDNIILIEDINPQAPFHALAIPKIHVPTMLELKPEHSSYLFKACETISKVMKDKNYAEDGFRVVLNTNRAAGQTVFHIHFHVLAGRLFNVAAGLIMRGRDSGLFMLLLSYITKGVNR